jgi:hypothetical protein
MKKQTAVEWLQAEIDNKDMGEIPMWIYEFIEKAKAMEKEQIREAYIYAFGERDEIDKNLFFNPLAVEYNEKKFYNYLSETYKSYEQ